MLLLMLALHIAPVAMPPVEPQRTTQKRATKKRTARKTRRTRISTARLNILTPACRTPTAGCGRDRNDKYRIADTQEVADPKARALQGPFANCGVTGMPVCPSKGRKILTSE